MNVYGELGLMPPITTRRLLVAIAQRLDGIKSADDKEERTRRCVMLAAFLEGYMGAELRKQLLEEELGDPTFDRWPD